MQTHSFNFADWPIKYKLSAIVIFTSGLLIFVMAVAVALEKSYSYRERLVKYTNVMAEIVGTNSTAALTFRDNKSASEILAALKADKDIVAAALYNAQGEVFVTYAANNTSGRTADNVLPRYLHLHKSSSRPHFTSQYFDVIRPIKLAGKTIGHILVRTDLTALERQLQYFFLIISGFSLLLIVFGIIICSRLNRTIIGPVTYLARSMREVTDKQNFEIRVTKRYNDEIGVLFDGFNSMLTQIEKRDAELAEHRNHLEELVDTRTRELKIANKQLLIEVEERQEAQARLAHAQKMEAIGTLAGGVAHDLNNILSGIVTYPDLLLLSLPKDSTLLKPIETIRTSGKKAAAIVQDLLTLARRGVKVSEEIDLQQLIEDYLGSPECLELLRNHPRVDIHFDPQDESFLMTGSPVHLSKTIMNLMSNAVEACVDGGAIDIRLDEIYLDSRPADFNQWREGPYLRLTISDTGIGIPPKYLDRIFEPFYSRKVMGRSGTGLGMAVVWGTVEDHKGLITVASKEGEGTTFQLFFPAGCESATSLAQTDWNEDQFRGYGQTILVVDDSEEQRQIASDILEHLGYISTSVASGEAAVQYLRQHSADLILLDMLMAPGIDGLETYKQILSFRNNQKAVIASGYSQAAPIEEARALGVAEYVLKPYTVRRIGRAVFNALHTDSDH